MRIFELLGFQAPVPLSAPGVEFFVGERFDLAGYYVALLRKRGDKEV